MRRHASVLGPIPALILLGALTSSCFFYKGYPKDWAPLETNSKNSCWQIVGTYNDKGEFSGKEHRPVSLSDIILFGVTVAWNSKQIMEGATVKIAKISEDSMEISTWQDGKQVYDRILSRGKKQFSCSSKGVTIPQGRSGVAGEGFEVGSKWEHLNLAVNKEGSLVIEAVESEVGAFLIIPVAGGGSAWATFKRIESAEH